MAWRNINQLIEGRLDNTHPGRITGYLRFIGLPEPVFVVLNGDFHRDIRGAAITFRGTGEPGDQDDTLLGFATYQTGEAGDITLGRAPFDYGTEPYIEWYSDQNGRVVLAPDLDKIELVGTPLPFAQTTRIDRVHQDKLMVGLLTSMARGLDVPSCYSTKYTDERGRPYTHWVTSPDGSVVAEASILEVVDQDLVAVHVRLPESQTPVVGVVTPGHLKEKASTPVA